MIRWAQHPLHTFYLRADKRWQTHRAIRISKQNNTKRNIIACRKHVSGIYYRSNYICRRCRRHRNVCIVHDANLYRFFCGYDFIVADAVRQPQIVCGLRINHAETIVIGWLRCASRRCVSASINIAGAWRWRTGTCEIGSKCDACAIGVVI